MISRQFRSNGPTSPTPRATGPASSSLYSAKAPKPEVRHTFLHFNTREESADFFPETGVEEFLPPRLVGRRARTPDPIRALPEEAEPPSALRDFNALLPDGWETSTVDGGERMKKVVAEAYHLLEKWQQKDPATSAGIFPFGMPRDPEAQRLAFNEMFPSRGSSFDPESIAPRVPPRVSAVTRPPEPFMDDASSRATKNNDAAAKAPAAKKDKKKVKKKRVDYLGQLPADQKRELAKEVYDTMIKKGFTRPDGYLLMDVYLEIFRDMIGEDSQGRVALHQFANLLRVRSDLFEVFNISVQVAFN